MGPVSATVVLPRLTIVPLSKTCCDPTPPLSAEAADVGQPRAPVAPPLAKYRSRIAPPTENACCPVFEYSETRSNAWPLPPGRGVQSLNGHPHGPAAPPCAKYKSR
jgi:hypothetical protein